MMTPASTPKTSVPRIAAIAIQKSNRCTRQSRRISGTSIMPMTTASMIRAPSTGLGRFGEQRRQEQQGEQHGHARGERGQPGLGPGVVVQRARGQAGRDRHPLEHAGADVGQRLRDRLLVDVDLVAVLGGERPRVAGGLGEADQHQRHRRERDRAGVVPQQLASPGTCSDGQPARHVADQRHARGARGRTEPTPAARRRRGPGHRGPAGRSPGARRRRPAR